MPASYLVTCARSSVCALALLKLSLGSWNAFASAWPAGKQAEGCLGWVVLGFESWLASCFTEELLSAHVDCFLQVCFSVRFGYEYLTRDACVVVRILHFGQNSERERVPPFSQLIRLLVTLGACACVCNEGACQGQLIIKRVPRANTIETGTGGGEGAQPHPR